MLLPEPVQQPFPGSANLPGLWPAFAAIRPRGWSERLVHAFGEVSSVLAERRFGPDLTARIEIARAGPGWTLPAWTLLERRGPHWVEVEGDMAASVEVCARAAERHAALRHYQAELQALTAGGRA